jgi:hypothetical protein
VKYATKKEGPVEMQYATMYVPQLRGEVEVQRIPPAALRIIKSRSMKGGRLDLRALMILKLVHGLKQPALTDSDACELTQRLTLGTLRPIIDAIDRLSGTDEQLRGDAPRHTLGSVAVMATAWLNRFPASAGHRREPRRARSVHRRESARGQRATSSSSDDPDPDPEPCACGCGRPRTAGSYHDPGECKRAHDRERKRQQRARDRANPDAAADRRAQHALAHVAFDAIRCRCNPRHSFALQSPDGDAFCFQCGRWTVSPAAPVNGFDDFRREMEQRDLLARVSVTPREWRTRPTRTLSAQLRRTRRGEVSASR